LLMVRYTVTDSTSSRPPTEERLNELANKMSASLQSDKPPQFARVWGQDQIAASQKLSPLTTDVRIDNKLSENFTIVEVFTFDRPGLLYALSRKLHELKLVIRHAKIGTYLDQVVDVFYVTGRDSQKIWDDGYLEHIKRQLHEAIGAE
jgi:[protein-PII] uridylyltransferase